MEGGEAGCSWLCLRTCPHRRGHRGRRTEGAWTCLTPRPALSSKNLEDSTGRGPLPATMQLPPLTAGGGAALTWFRPCLCTGHAHDPTAVGAHDRQALPLLMGMSPVAALHPTELCLLSPSPDCPVTWPLIHLHPPADTVHSLTHSLKKHPLFGNDIPGSGQCDFKNVSSFCVAYFEEFVILIILG